MSRNRNYQNFYSKPEVPANETPVEEVQTAEIPEAPVEEAKTEDIQEKIKEYAVVIGDKKVNMRTEPKKDAAVVTVLAPGTRVETHEFISPAWTKVSYEDKSGFMMSQFLRPEN